VEAPSPTGHTYAEPACSCTVKAFPADSYDEWLRMLGAAKEILRAEIRLVIGFPSDALAFTEVISPVV
jgi:hypothetical protein